jgi:hypothetical protein
MARKLALLAVFGVAMAHLEGVVVVYLREVLTVAQSASNTATLDAFTLRYLWIEQTREAATIVMLVTVAWLVGRTWLERAVFLLWTFAFWDLFYYASLYLLLGWPSTLTTLDVLFLIPAPWVAPVWVPIGISSLTILAIATGWLALRNRQGGHAGAPPGSV